MPEEITPSRIHIIITHLACSDLLTAILCLRYLIIVFKNRFDFTWCDERRSKYLNLCRVAQQPANADCYMKYEQHR